MWTANLPHASAVAKTVAATAGAVATPEITSTSFITGAGLKKCIPRNRSGRFRSRAMDVSEIDEVLLARLASSATIPSSWPKSDRLTSRFSTMASTTSATPARSSSADATVIRPSSASTSAFVILPRATRPFRPLPMRALPFSATPSKAS